MDEAYLAVLEFRDSQTAEVEREYMVALQAPEVVLVEHGSQGPPGPPGPDGGSAVQRVAGEQLSALCMVYELNGKACVLDPQDADHIDLVLGMTITAAPAGGAVNVQRSGWVEDSGWTWQPGRVWLGPNGTLTQIAPADGYDLLIGAATSATRITLDIQDPIELED